MTTTARNKPERRLLEFSVVSHHAVHRAEHFKMRLIRNLKATDGCMLWQGALDRNGYARINFRVSNPRSTLKIGVHRVFMMLKTAAPIPADLEVGHVGCFSRNCVRHIELQTRQENLASRRWG